MNIKILHESDMELCYDIDSTFLCEEYINSLKINNLKSVEFITIYNGKILFIEAKKTAPFPKNIEIENSDYKKIYKRYLSKSKRFLCNICFNYNEFKRRKYLYKIT